MSRLSTGKLHYSASVHPQSTYLSSHSPHATKLILKPGRTEKDNDAAVWAMQLFAAPFRQSDAHDEDGALR